MKLLHETENVTVYESDIPLQELKQISLKSKLVEPTTNDARLLFGVVKPLESKNIKILNL